MFFFACPACSSRIAMCVGRSAPVVSRCPECSVLLAFIHEQRTLIDVVKDSWTPSELIEGLRTI